jgi:hypothetical protein
MTKYIPLVLCLLLQSHIEFRKQAQIQNIGSDPSAPFDGYSVQPEATRLVAPQFPCDQFNKQANTKTAPPPLWTLSVKWSPFLSFASPSVHA